MAFKMKKGSPMYRNFGVGSPLHDDGPTPDSAQQAPPQGSIDGVPRKNKKGNKPISPVPQRGDSNTAIAKAESRTASEKTPTKQRGDSNTAIAKAESRTASEKSPVRQVTKKIALSKIKKEISGYSKRLKVELEKVKNNDKSADLEFISMARTRIQEAAKLSGSDE